MALFLFGCSFVSNSLQPHGLQHLSLLQSSPYSRACSNSCLLSWWMPSNGLVLCPPLLLVPSIFPSIRVFSNEWLFSSGGQSIGALASSSVLPMNIQDWFPLGFTCLISCSPRDSQEPSLATQFKNIDFLEFSLHYGPTLTSVHDYWKNHSFDYLDLCLPSNVSAF